MLRRSQTIRQVALLVESSRNYGRGVLRGVGRYVQAHGQWKIYHTERKASEAAPPWLKTWRGDGIIASIENHRLGERIRALHVPVVNLYEHPGLARFPAVWPDNDGVARLAAEHLLERGLKHFAFCGLPGVYSSDERETCFIRRMAEAGFEVHRFAPPRRFRKTLIAASELSALRSEGLLVQWVRSLPKPVGVMACNDRRAHHVLIACDAAGIAVPEEAAIIGVGNDEVVCGLARPPLSSVEQNSEDVGYHAAALLDRLMQGEPAPKRPLVIPPRGVVARQSTDVVAVADVELAAALHYIRKHACDGLSVDELASSLAVSRRTLERLFRAGLGRSPKNEIARVQLGHVMRLLSMTDHPLEKIAQLTGFRYVGSMCVLFRNQTGRTPGQYRREVRAAKNG